MNYDFWIDCKSLLTLKLQKEENMFCVYHKIIFDNHYINNISLTKSITNIKLILNKIVIDKTSKL